MCEYEYDAAHTAVLINKVRYTGSDIDQTSLGREI